MKDKKIIVETQYFPSIAWFAVGCSHGSLHVDISENYNKRSLRNKSIVTHGGNQTALSVPLKKGKHQNRNIAQVHISNEENWRLNHRRAIQTAYGKTPYFIHYTDFILNLINDPADTLFEYNLNIINRINIELDLGIHIKLQNAFVPNSDDENFVIRDHFKYSGAYSTLESKLKEYLVSLEDKIHIPYTLTPRNSILDLIFYLGPETRLFLSKLPNIIV